MPVVTFCMPVLSHQYLSVVLLVAFQTLTSLIQPKLAPELPSRMFVTSDPSSGKSAVGLAVGLMLGDADGDFVGLEDGDAVGLTLGSGGINTPGNSTSAKLRDVLSGVLVSGNVNLYSK